MIQGLITGVTFLIRLPLMLLIGGWFILALILTSMHSAWQLMHVFIGLLPETYQQIGQGQEDSLTAGLANQAIALSKDTLWHLCIVIVNILAIPFAILVGSMFAFGMCFTSLRRWRVEGAYARSYQARRDRNESLEELGAEIDRLELLPGLKRKLKERLGLEIETEAQSNLRNQMLAKQYELIDNYFAPQRLKDWLKSATAYNT
jgi:hypothetical protein